MKAIVWDLDDTIYQQPDGYYESCYRAAARAAIAHGYSGSEQDAFDAARLSYATYGYSLACFFKDHGLAQDAIEKTYADNSVTLISACGRTNEYIRAFDGPQIIVSHSPKVRIDAFIQKLDLHDMFPDRNRIGSEIITSDGKTISTRPFEMARDLIQGYDAFIPVEEMNVFEDAWYNLRQAKIIGMETSLVTNGHDIAMHSFIDHRIERPYQLPFRG